MYNEVSDTELIDFLQKSPNPRLSQLIDVWCSLDGGVTLRGAIRKLMEDYDDKTKN
jgi:hypothetical protein